MELGTKDKYSNCRVLDYPSSPIDKPFIGDNYFDKDRCELYQYKGTSGWSPVEGLVKSVWGNARFKKIAKRVYMVHDQQWIFLIDFFLEHRGLSNFRRVREVPPKYLEVTNMLPKSRLWHYIFDDDTDLNMFMFMFADYVYNTTYISAKY